MSLAISSWMPTMLLIFLNMPTTSPSEALILRICSFSRSISSASFSTVAWASGEYPAGPLARAPCAFSKKTSSLSRAQGRALLLSTKGDCFSELTSLRLFRLNSSSRFRDANESRLSPVTFASSFLSLAFVFLGDSSAPPEESVEASVDCSAGVKGRSPFKKSPALTFRPGAALRAALLFFPEQLEHLGQGLFDREEKNVRLELDRLDDAPLLAREPR